MDSLMYMTAGEIAAALDQTLDDLEIRLERSPFADIELEAVMGDLYRIARTYEALDKQDTTCCQTTA